MVKISIGTPEGRIGTIIDNYVDIDLNSGYRTEKALVLWDGGDYEWVSVGVLSVLF